MEQGSEPGTTETPPTAKSLVAITGASSGIGRATAIEFAKAGYPLLLIARRLELLESLQLEQALCMNADVRDADALAAAFDTAEARFGGLGCLVNCAGVMEVGPLEAQSPKAWQTMFDINVLGLLNGVHVALKHMKSRGTGTIVNVGSVAGRRVTANYVVYCATKHAVHAISEGLNLELANAGIRVINVAPGLVETELYDGVPSDTAEKEIGGRTKAEGRALSASDVAKGILFAVTQPADVAVHELVLQPTRTT